MPTNRKKRLRLAVSRMSPDQEQHLLEGWALDGCVPWYEVVGYPFRDPGHRRRVWTENREYLLGKCPPGTVAAAAVEYEGATSGPTPPIWATRSGPAGQTSVGTSGQEAHDADE